MVRLLPSLPRRYSQLQNAWVLDAAAPWTVSCLLPGRGPAGQVSAACVSLRVSDTSPNLDDADETAEAGHCAELPQNIPRTSHAGLEALAGLCELYAGGNPLATLRTQRPLAALRCLALLGAAGCPLAALPDYRHHCLFHLPALQARSW